MVRSSTYRNVETSAGAHLASYLIRIEDSFPRVKPPERAADHSPPSTVEVKNDWSYTSTPPIRLHGVYKDTFIVYKSHKQEGKQTIRHALKSKVMVQLQQSTKTGDIEHACQTAFSVIDCTIQSRMHRC